MQTGRVPKRIFVEESSIEVGGFRISREAHQKFNSDQRRTMHQAAAEVAAEAARFNPGLNGEDWSGFGAPR